MKNIKTLHPSYLHSFQCIGSDCKNSCCSKWNIPVDKNTYKKYKSSNHPLLKNKSKELFLKKNSHIYFKLDKNSNCPFLNEKKLCSIHENLGYKVLPDICKSYPRHYKVIDDIHEVDLFMSCEAAAKIILENKDGIQFQNEVIDVPSDLVDTQTINSEHLIGRYFWAIRTLFIDILQYRVISLNERLLLIATIINILKDIKTDVEISNLISNIECSLEKGEYINILNNQSEDKEQLFERQMFLILSLTNNVLFTAIKESGNSQNKQLGLITCNYDLYKETYYSKYLKFIEENEYILENYLVNLFFCVQPTFSTVQELEDKYIALIGRLALFKYTITASLQQKDSITFEDIYLIVSRLSRYIDHKNKTNNLICEIFKENNKPLINAISIISI